MAKRVNAETCLLVDLAQKGGHGLLHGAHADATTSASEEHRHAIAARADRPKQHVALRLVVAKCERRRVADRHDALLAALATHLDLLRHQVEIRSTQPLELGQTHSRRIEQLEDGEVAYVDESALPRSYLGGLKQEADLRAVQVTGEMPLQPRRPDRARRVGVDELVAVHVAIEAADGGQGARH